MKEKKLLSVKELEAQTPIVLPDRRLMQVVTNSGSSASASAATANSGIIAVLLWLLGGNG